MLAWTLDNHVHADQITAALRLKQRVGSRSAAPAIEQLPCVDQGLIDNVPLKFDSHSLDCLHTPGHTESTSHTVLAIASLPTTHF